jgi:hypothetical protein
LQVDHSATTSLVLQRMYELQLFTSGLNTSPPHTSERELISNEPPSTSIILVNLFWFSSLLFSLFAALFGIFVKQWLRNYGKWDEQGTHEESILLRGWHLRGFERWHVPGIVSALPMLMQVALILFLAGLLIYMWTINTILATFLTALLGCFALILTSILFLPMLHADCPYKSPIGLAVQALAYRAGRLAVLIPFYIFSCFACSVESDGDYSQVRNPISIFFNARARWMHHHIIQPLDRSISSLHNWRIRDVHRSPLSSLAYLTAPSSIAHTLGVSPESLEATVSHRNSYKVSERAIALNRIQSLAPDVAYQMIARITRHMRRSSWSSEEDGEKFWGTGRLLSLVALLARSAEPLAQTIPSVQWNILLLLISLDSQRWYSSRKIDHELEQFLSRNCSCLRSFAKTGVFFCCIPQ